VHQDCPNQKFTKKAARRNHIKVLAAIALLTQAERQRVLDHAEKVNGI
jgi:hypothetical protein